MARPEWITPDGSLGVIPEGIFFQLALLADTPVIASVVCTATSANGAITCTSTAGLYPNLNVMFTGAVFGGVSAGRRYFVNQIISPTQFSISQFANGQDPIQLISATGNMVGDFTQNPYFVVQAGHLPPGIQCTDTGLLEGIPKAVASLQGVPLEVSQDVTSKFTVRAYTTKPINGRFVVDRIAERTFSLTVTGQDAPEFLTPAGSIGTFYDGTLVPGLQVEYTDTDPADLVAVRLFAGSLPPGLSIDPRGLISGFISPASPISAIPGYSRDEQGYSQYPYDFAAQSTDYNYEFVLEVTDGKASNLRTFSIQVFSRNGLTADNTQITADNTFITADVTPVRTPILLTPEGSLGRVRSDNFYAFKFNGIDTDGDAIIYDITLGQGIGFDAANVNFAPGSFDREGFDRGAFLLPPGLTLDPTTGWLYGYIPDQGLTERTYTFAIRVAKANDPLVISQYYYFTITIIGNVDTEVTWLVPDYLGEIDTGNVSTLYVAAVNAAGIPLEYRLKSGAYSDLPQGLRLLPSGNIAGRVSFNTFAVDGNTTTFDIRVNDVGFTDISTQTTFDRTFRFTVEAYGGNGYISTYREFVIKVDRIFNQPYENLYIEAMPPENDRAMITGLLQNQDIIPTSLLYRPDDPNFGRAQKVVYWHAYGLTSSTYEKYVSSLYKNHYWKNLVLGSIETAQALDEDGNVLYEVVYSTVSGGLTNSQGQSVSKQVTLPYEVVEIDGTVIKQVYPNSLANMRDQVIDVVGRISNLLPRWMLSKQANGRVLGFTPAWVIAYTKPGQSARIKYNIETQFGSQLNKVDFKVDRYELDRLLSIHWDPFTQNWFPAPAETTFDRFGRPNDLRYIGDVDYATNLAFVDINGRTLDYINSLGGLDGLVGGNPTGKTLIFVTQENYNEPINSYTPGPIPSSLAWTRYTVPFGDAAYSADGNLFDEAEIIPGEIEAASNPLLTNQRMGVWRISVSSQGIVTLTLLKDTIRNDYVTVINGQRYKTSQLYRPSVPGFGLTLINWQPLPSSLAATQTYFDGGSMRFIAPVDMPTNTQAFDRYLVFPKRNIIGPAGSIVVPWVNNQSQVVAWVNSGGLTVAWTDISP